MSAIGTQRTCRVALHMSTFGGKADIARAFPNVHSSPKADIGRADCELGRPTFAFSCPDY